jgi:hypothetical protein
MLVVVLCCVFAWLLISIEESDQRTRRAIRYAGKVDDRVEQLLERIQFLEKKLGYP